MLYHIFKLLTIFFIIIHLSLFPYQKHTVSQLVPRKESSNDEILVCLSLLDGFCSDYFHVYGGLEGANELSRISKKIWELEKSLSYGRSNNQWSRENCVTEMQEIMSKVKVVSSHQYTSSEAKLSGKVALLHSARSDESVSIRDLETKYPSPQLGKLIRELKFETFDAEHRLLQKLTSPKNLWTMSSATFLNISFDGSVQGQLDLSTSFPNHNEALPFENGTNDSCVAPTPGTPDTPGIIDQSIPTSEISSAKKKKSIFSKMFRYIFRGRKSC